jgi:hypothetical protein
MNFFEYIFFIISGPVGMPPRSDKIFWLANIFVLIYLPQSYPIAFVALGLGTLSLMLNFYQALTGTLITNGQFAEFDNETSEQIDEVAKRNGVTVVKKALVTNFTIPVVMMGRSKFNAEIYASNHWFQDDETRKHFTPMLEGVIANTHRAMILLQVIPAVFYAACLFALLAIKPFLMVATPYGLYVLVFLNTVLEIPTSYITAAHLRYSTYQQDTTASRATSPQAVQDAIAYFQEKTNYDNSVASMPDWKLVLPKNVARIARLEKLKQENAS